MRTFIVRLSLICLIGYSPLSWSADPQWVEVRSPNFSVITDAGEKRGRDVALHFEQMRSVFGSLMTKANVNLSVPLQIVAFRNTKELRQVAPIFHGKATEIAGLFQGGEDRDFIMLDMSVEDPWTVVFHEYAHQLMNGNLSFRIDPWFAEGFAEYFSSIQVDDKGARVGSFPEQTYDILQQLGMMKVADLLRVQQYTKTYNESGDHRTTFYAESSLVVHYLYDNLLVPKLSVYFEALQLQNKSADQAFQAAFGMSTAQFDRVLLDYFHSDRFRHFDVPTPPGIVAAQFNVTPVSLADARAVLADIHAHSLDYRAHALDEFQDVLKMDPNNASALRGVGYLYLQRHDFDHAEEYFRHAAEQNSKDPRLHYYYAMLLSQRGNANEERSTQVKKELLTAIALDPKFADSYSLLGYTQAISGEPEKGMETMQKAIALAPRNESFQFNLANIYMANRKVDEAIAILRSLAGSADPDVQNRANRALAEAENFKAQSQAFALRVEERNSERRPEDTPENKPTRRAATTTENITENPSARVEAPIPMPVHFVKGKLVSVDCSASPQAVLTFSAGAKALKLHVRDSEHAIVIGADRLSCEWKNKNLAVNYRERPDGEGDVVSLEVQ